jgi:hypothetical protein
MRAWFFVAPAIAGSSLFCLASCGGRHAERDDAGADTLVDEGDGEGDAAPDAARDSDQALDGAPDSPGPDAPADVDSPESDADVDAPLERVGQIGTFFVSDVSVVGDTAYLTVLGDEGDEGLQVLDVSERAAPRLVAHEVFRNAEAVSVLDGVAYVAVSREGLRIFDVGDPARPAELCRHATPGGPSDVVVQSGYAYVADGYEGLRILDVADPAVPRDMGFWILTGQASTLDVQQDRGLAFVVGTDNLLHVVDVGDRAHPASLATANLPDRPSAIDVQGAHAYVAACEAGLRIIDVGDPADPRNVGSFGLSTADGHRYCVRAVAAAPPVAYLAAEERDWHGVLVVDVSDPTLPVLLGRVATAEAWSLFVDEVYLYVAQVQAGLAILRRR